MNKDSEGADRFVEDELYVSTTTDLITDDGHKLVLTAEEEIPYEFTFGIKEREEETDVLYSVVRLVDNKGTEWIGESFWSVDEILEQLTNFFALSPPRKFSSLSVQAQAQFESACFFKDARALLDDRFYRELHVEGVIYTVNFKYQSPLLDLAFVEDGLVARASRLQAEGTGSSKEPFEIPPILFEVDVSQRLFVNYGYKNAESECWEFEMIPRPFLWKKSGARKDPQPLVQYG